MPPSPTLPSSSRRRLLRLCGLSLLLPLLPAGCATEQDERTGWMELGKRLTGLDEETMLQIGESRNGALSTDQLLDSLPPLTSGHWRRNGLHPGPSQAPVSEVAEHIREQYRRKQTDVVDRWILSKLELTIISLATGAS